MLRVYTNDGKLAGMIWRGSNGKMHAYGYNYDANGRLVSADYRKYEDQMPGQVYGWSNVLTDRSVSGIEYDKNGNLLKMVQKGPEAIQVVPYSHGVNIDDLTYTYQAKSNRLDGVADAVTQDHGIGDFQDGHTGTDYAYDANGNLTMDLNKGIASASFTRFNKPSIITMSSGGSIVNSYDAGGNKIQEKIIQATHTDTTDYLGNFVYRNGALSYIQTATGRTVFENDGTTNEEYFVKDNLGNLRTVVDVHEYPVLEYLSSYELASANLEGLFFDHQDEVRDDKPGSTDPSDMKAGRLNGNDPERRIGTAMMLKVMAGDKLELNVNSFYNGYESSKDEPVNSQDMLESVVSTLTNGVGGLEGGEAHDPDMVGRMFSPENWDRFNDMFQDEVDPDKPKAFLNYVLFSEDGTLIPGGSGRFQANGDGTWMPMGTPIPIVIPANGYMGIFLSNSSQITEEDGSGAGDVYFDLLKVRFSRGNLKEENHYYPFGLPMGDISGTAAGFVSNRHRYQGNEYEKDLGVNWMDFHARQYDPQIGRFLGVDPLADMYGQEEVSPYVAMGDNPVMSVDPDGLYEDGKVYRNLTENDVQITAKRLPSTLFELSPMISYRGNPALANWYNGPHGYAPRKMYGWGIEAGGGPSDNRDAPSAVKSKMDPANSDKKQIALNVNVKGGKTNGGSNVKGIVSASFGIAGGFLEWLGGGVLEWFSGTTATPLTIPLFIDGGVRMAANSARLGAYIDGDDKIGDAIPSSAGAAVGKAADMAAGNSFDDVGLGQSIGGATNDLVSFVFTGGSAQALSDVIQFPSPANVIIYVGAIPIYTWGQYDNFSSLKH